MENYEKEHLELVRKMTPECMVLMKSDGAFPLEGPVKIALYGSGARRTVKGGGGSGDVNVRSFTTVEQGLENAGFTVTTKAWLNGYEEERRKAKKEFRAKMKEKIAEDGIDRLMENLTIVMPEPDYELPLDGEGETAVYVLARFCSEGADRLETEGDLFLSRTEIRDILALQEKYRKFLLVLNTACMVDLSPVAEQVGNILLLSQPGMAVGDAFADVLLGRTYPSGKLAATWTAWDDFCKEGEFGGRDDVRYREGIYVGYRWFDTAEKKPLFPFGHGLSYTEFVLNPGAVKAQGTEVRIPVSVKNTGSRPGKEVVQAYVSVPSVKLDQPYQTLAAFAKTKELLPGEETQAELSFHMEDLASYDAESVSRILEAGSYLVRVGNSSRNTCPVCSLNLEREVTVEQVHSLEGKTDFTDWKPEKAGAGQDGGAVWNSGNGQDYGTGRDSGAGQTDLPVIRIPADAFRPAVHRRPQTDAEALALAETLTDEELAYLCTGDFVDEGSRSIIGNAAITVAGAAGETTPRFRKYGVENLVLADGPAGLRISREYGVDENGVFEIKPEQEDNPAELIPEDMMQAVFAAFPSAQPQERHGEKHEQNCTAIPVAAALAQSFNPDLAEQCGEIVADEMKRFGVQIWLAPSMNIQRTPLCGRNFEYYSEDPLVSGKMAAAVTRGVQKTPGLSVTVKHFICNNQETNRFRSNSMVNVRALRDIYARGFEIAVKEAQPHAVMTSYNLVNGVHTSEQYSLLEEMLREEWGFEGIAMSDWLGGEPSASDRTNKYRKFASAQSIAAGLDILMPGGKGHYENLLQARKNADENEVETARLTREQLVRAAARMIAFAWKLKGKDGADMK
ncbi:glycoside hydrolase family 3 N-terminal domain-containing protein [Lachnoclostridium sp. An169]|uniref:glycoside hydrolase family 3 N-terminal domain-containing protein n=1 Tax=Lachnoclostridium sp. An169 TaxID=1965569 RepID=UPI00194E463E|nr:glycoside hydrolase family 3 N-terminal domain-containing protein [Lachnoclostridium sp. An169]